MQLLAVLDNGSTEPLNAVPFEALVSPAMIMEYMDQGDLHEYIQRKKYDEPVAMTVSTTDVALVLARALADLHGQGIIHRYVRSHSIFLSTTHYIRLGNIGSSRAHDDMATSGFVTKYWMAPEVLHDRFGGVRPAYTAAADIYALGAVLTKLDTLQEPYYDVKDRWSIEENVRTGQLRPHMSDTCPPWLNDLVNQCLAFDPAERPTADGHGEALNATLPVESPSTLMDLMASAQRLRAMGLEVGMSYSTSSTTHEWL
ncbi:serine/threonine protein kinase [Saprolegnia parasitica CBS 223.65]|uniref:Serine/threonine protein kinase n=1 Tax=Saprolegnia parasitica (strain CBS 223.65) TaxID=695850 RepID=A0A067CDZ1_SAPPC|nr:serine/threonine protein kinase [Saprolegnia parasitica CBS 223.65]KDO25042.1 serine/threonine protein kinase [Saprolegnia parasitica CBS 223.65]|eukprot:XP_012204310.1 serine/threonine protein kinase [Saprolegnia parasitica CBS 223.65]